MKCVVVLLVALAAAVSGFQYTEEWEAWKEEHGQVYESDEIELRRHITWESNMQFVKQHNAHADEIGFTVEMNKFADLETNEFVEMYTGLLDRDADSDNNSTLFMPEPDLEQVRRLPRTVDWRKKGVVTAVKNQGRCGSCYAFSAIGALESAYAIKKRKLYDLSEQQIVDCTYRKFGNSGCKGGWMNNAFRYLTTVRGSQTERSYPYKAKLQKCQYNARKARVPCKGYLNVRSGSESSLQFGIARVGPISVAFDASFRSFQLYRGGVYNEPRCLHHRFSHAALAVGYGYYGRTACYIVKNSYGKRWGMNGYILMSRNRDNQCGIANVASVPVTR